MLWVCTGNCGQLAGILLGHVEELIQRGGAGGRSVAGARAGGRRRGDPAAALAARHARPQPDKTQSASAEQGAAEPFHASRVRVCHPCHTMAVRD